MQKSSKAPSLTKYVHPPSSKITLKGILTLGQHICPVKRGNIVCRIWLEIKIFDKSFRYLDDCTISKKVAFNICVFTFDDRNCMSSCNDVAFPIFFLYLMFTIEGYNSIGSPYWCKIIFFNASDFGLKKKCLCLTSFR